MGWLNERFPEHEGYLIGFVAREPGSTTLVRELAFPDDDRDLAEIKWIAVGCECGWRSPRLVAPFGTKWAPFSVVLEAEDEEDHARAIWRDHCESLRGIVRDGIAGTLRELAKHPASAPCASCGHASSVHHEPTSHENGGFTIVHACRGMIGAYDDVPCGCSKLVPWPETVSFSWHGKGAGRYAKHPA